MRLISTHLNRTADKNNLVKSHMLCEILKPRLRVQVVNGISIGSANTKRSGLSVRGNWFYLISRGQSLSRRHSVSVYFVSSRSLCQKCMPA